jgi:tetratricopeptide (TPR) repeat protein
VQKDQGGNLTRFVEQAKALSAATQTIDAATAYVEAAELARDLPAMIGPSPLDAARAERAMTLLEQALTARPGLVRARVLRARLLAARSQSPLARGELEQVIAAVPKHAEAKELLDDLTRLDAGAGAATASATPAPSPTPAAAASPVTSAPPAPSASPVASAPPAPSAAPASASTSPASTPPAARASASPVASASPTPGARPSAPPRPTEVARREPTPAAEASSTSDRGGAKGNVAGKGFDALMKQAERLRQRGEAWEALLSYEKAAELRPGAGRAYAGMGWCYLDLSKPEAALHQFRKAIAVEGGYAEGHLGHAEAYRALGNADKALASYRQFLTLKPQGTEAEAARRAIASLEGGR